MVIQTTSITPLYNRCLRCHRKIKAPQQYGRVCARKMNDYQEFMDTGSADAAGDEVLHCGAKTSFPLGRTKLK